MNHGTTACAAAMALLFAIPGLSIAGEANPVAKAENAPPEQLQQEARPEPQAEVHWFGMTLVDPTEEWMQEYRLPREHIGPIVARIENPSFFLAGHAPTPGCAFWIVEHPAYGFFVNNKEKPRHFPKNVRELAQAIVSCAVSPEEYRRVVDEALNAAKERAEKLKDDPAERERLLAFADTKLPEDYAGKYVCRVVYHYPYGVGTMTTQILMAKVDLDKLHQFLKEPQPPLK